MSFNDETDDERSGSSLRKELEETRARNKALEADLVKFKAREVITSKGYDMVEPDDLAGVSEAELEAKAEALQKQREGVVQNYLRRQFAAQGLEGEDLDAAVAEAFSGSPGGRQGDEEREIVEQFSRARDLTSIGGAPTAAQNLDKLHGQAAIEAGLAAAAKRKR